MPDFHIDGDAGAIRARTATMRSKAETFVATGDALAAISTDGWTGRAAERFLDKFSTEPQRWHEAGNGFIRAAGALEAFADALTDAKGRASWAESEYARGDRVTHEARAAYDADVSSARQEVSTAAAHGQTMTLTILPFDDPGEQIRHDALAEYASAKADLDKAAHLAADGVRAGCVDAPEKRKWYEKVGAAIGGFVMGAGEALYDLGKLVAFLSNPAAFMFADMMSDVADGMTPEEIAAKNQLRVEDAQNMFDALRDDPLEFGKNIGKAMLDWDTWADDPARALGHLVPDAIAAFFTAGTGTVATRGAKGATDLVEGLADMSRASRGIDDIADLSKLDDLGDLSRLDDISDIGRFDDIPTGPQGTFRGLDDAGLDSWLDEVTARHPELSRDGVRGIWDYTTDNGYDTMNGALRRPETMTPEIEARIERANEGLSQLPAHEGTTYRGTNLPDSVLDRVNTDGILSDKAFSSSSLRPDVAENFINHAKDNPVRVTVQGHSGVDVRPFSAAQGEAEILFKGGIEFQVVDKHMGADGVLELVVREP